MLLRELNGPLDRTLLMWANHETKVLGIDGLAVFGKHNLGAGSRHPLNARENPHCFIRESSGSNRGWLPTTATFTGNSSFMYMTLRSAPSTGR